MTGSMVSLLGKYWPNSANIALNEYITVCYGTATSRISMGLYQVAGAIST